MCTSVHSFVLKLPDLGWRVITNAHAVEYGSIVQLRRRGGADKVEAVIEAVGNECDLALLRVCNFSLYDSELAVVSVCIVHFMISQFSKYLSLCLYCKTISKGARRR